MRRFYSKIFKWTIGNNLIANVGNKIYVFLLPPRLAQKFKANVVGFLDGVCGNGAANSDRWKL